MANEDVLMSAVLRGDVDGVQQALSNLPLNAHIGHELTRAARGGHDKIVTMLLGSPQAPRADRSFSQALVDAAERGHLGCATLLLSAARHPADVNCQDGSLLDYATQNDKEDMVRLLLRHGARADIDDCRALKTAINFDRVNIAAELLASCPLTTVMIKDLVHEARRVGASFRMQRVLAAAAGEAEPGAGVDETEQEAEGAVAAANAKAEAAQRAKEEYERWAEEDEEDEEDEQEGSGRWRGDEGFSPVSKFPRLS